LSTTLPAPRQCLVTGGAGLIGSHLVDALLARGDRVTCVDDLRSGRSANLAQAQGHARFAMQHGDVASLEDVACDIVFNLACPASPVFYQRDPVGTIETAVLGAIRVFAIARKHGAVVVHASTSEVYGDPAVHPQTEDYWGHVNPIGPRACYDEGKRCAEALAASHAGQYATDIRVARIFNTYGPRMRSDDGRVVSNFIVQALAGAPITLHGGEQTRSFCYVADTVAGLLALGDAPRAPFGPVNLGNPDEITMRELAQRVIALTGSRSRVVVEPRPVDDPSRRRPDIALARERLGWSPRVPLDEGLARTIAHFRTAG